MIDQWRSHKPPFRAPLRVAASAGAVVYVLPALYQSQVNQRLQEGGRPRHTARPSAGIGHKLSSACHAGPACRARGPEIQYLKRTAEEAVVIAPWPRPATPLRIRREERSRCDRPSGEFALKLLRKSSAVRFSSTAKLTLKAALRCGPSML